jgi:hypothetical protein
MIRRIRWWIVSKLLNIDEKFLLARACEDRSDTLFRLSVTEKLIDYYDANADREILTLMWRNIFTTTLYK